MYKIGVDIGGTNTDAVLVDCNDNIIATKKTLTSSDIISGFNNAVDNILSVANANNKSQITRISVGTTHATNALLTKTNLYKVGIIRIAGHLPSVLPSCHSWNHSAKISIFAGEVTINGGFECDGTLISKLDTNEVKKVINKLINLGAESLAIIGVFAPLYNEHEKAIEQIILEQFNIPYSLSHEIGGIGFIERENATIINSSLKKSLGLGFNQLKFCLDKLNIQCPLMISQNNGTVVDLKTALKYPINTLTAGPTNSFIGAGKLAKLSDCVIADIGGTSTDIGFISNSFPRKSSLASVIDGIKFDFTGPDMISLAIGGGSIISQNTANDFDVGPESVGKELFSKAFSFGGKFLTLTDLSIALGQLNIVHNSKFQDKLLASKCISFVVEKIRIAKAEIEANFKNIPLVLVGGGAKLISESLLKDDVIIPPYSNVANAYGAALSELSSTIDCTISLSDKNKVLREIEERVIEKVKSQGAKFNVRIIDRQIIPYHYVSNNLARVIVTAAGKID